MEMMNAKPAYKVFIAKYRAVYVEGLQKTQI